MKTHKLRKKRNCDIRIFLNLFVVFIHGFQGIFNEKPHEKRTNFQKYPEITISFLSKFVSFYLIFTLITNIFCIFFKLFESAKIFNILCLFTWIFTENRKKWQNIFFGKNFFFEIFKIGKILKFFKNRGKQTNYHSDKKN